jgi:hypothetical protein
MENIAQQCFVLGKTYMLAILNDLINSKYMR